MNLLRLFWSSLLIITLTITKTASVHKHYAFSVAYMSGNPDGVTTGSILAVNYQFPGPEIRCKKGDTIHVKVTNLIRDKNGHTWPLSVHWHGLLMTGNVFDDGPDHVTQCPIAYGKSHEYVFTPNQVGTYWWHSHNEWQYAEGMWGPLIVEGDPESYKNYYNRELTLTFNDWYHKTGKENTDWFLSPKSQGKAPIPDSAMINGRGHYPCDLARQKGLACREHPRLEIKVVKGGKYRIRLINTSAVLTYQFYIERHKFEVIEADGVDTVAVPAETLMIEPAQRYSILVEMNKGNPGDTFRIHAVMANAFSKRDGNTRFPEAISTTSGQPYAIMKYVAGRKKREG